MSDLYMRRFIKNLQNIDKKQDRCFTDLSLITTDVSGIVKTVNMHFQCFTGYSFNDAVGINCNFMQLLDDKRNKKANMKVRHHIKNKLTFPLYVKFYNQTKHNSPFVMYSQIKPMISDGLIMGYYSHGSAIFELSKPYKMQPTDNEINVRNKIKRQLLYRALLDRSDDRFKV